MLDLERKLPTISEIDQNGQPFEEGVDGALVRAGLSRAAIYKELALACAKDGASFEPPLSSGLWPDGAWTDQEVEDFTIAFRAAEELADTEAF